MSYEILAPAGSKECAKAALLSGANAIYLGLNEFSARESAENFTLDDLRQTATFAHLLRAKVYVCLNTLVKDSEVSRLFEVARGAYTAGADGVLVQDIFLGKALKEAFPALELHLSTQAGTCNEKGACLAKEYGFSRVVLARETPLEEISRISKMIQTEVFVQGALCTCFSGQCYLSSFAGNNSGNRGRCKQPCRKKYKIDRKGYEDYAYALSPSDLCVGESVKELLEAGVYSLKIEGRLRRVEYVSAAVKYYRALLENTPANGYFSQLKRAFNRGDYTKGLTFGQKKDFLSRAVQGHIGERVGLISRKKGKYFCNGVANKGDGFKILRDGEEVGGAVCTASFSTYFELSSSQKLLDGDEVRLTTDSKNIPLLDSRRNVVLSLFFSAGQTPKIVCGEFIFEGKELVLEAKNSPMSEQELKACFQKTDGLPFEVTFERVQTHNAFLPKSVLNGIRRAFFEALVAHLVPQREELPPIKEIAITPRTECRRAIISPSLKGLKGDILILKPQDYTKITLQQIKEGEGEKFLYLPAYFTSADEELIKEVLPLFDGVYCEGYYGVVLAKQYGKKLFAGTGFHITNRYSLKGVKEAGASYIALSKELCAEEQKLLSGEGVFSLCAGGVKVMDLCYCPFEQTCSICDQREIYTLTDEGGREFPLRRVRFANNPCRFELYNCAPLCAFLSGVGELYDCTLEQKNTLSAKEKGLINATKGHFNRSLL